MREERSRSRRLHGRAAAREAVVPHTVAVKCKNCGRVTTTALPVRAVFPTSSCPFKVCSLSCGLLFHGSWKMAEAEAMEQPGFGGPTGTRRDVIDLRDTGGRYCVNCFE